ncbi:MAG: triphosphoribosyl-dephospho-CoA synthase [Halobacteriaceae archaeon]
MTPAERAQLALLVELAATPAPGNVDRERDHPDLRFEQFLAGAVGAGEGLRAAAGTGRGVGAAFEAAVGGMAAAAGTNTQFGALLLLVPLVRTAATGPLTRSRAAGVVGDTTVADAAAFYRAFDAVDVAVGEPPPDAAELDARRGADAVPAVEERGVTLRDVLALAEGDGVAAEWVEGFPRAFAVADRIAGGEGPLADRAARAFLAELARVPDSLVARRHGEAVAAALVERAADLRDADRERVAAFADELVERGVNPGTTADVVAAGVFVALERGVSV